MGEEDSKTTGNPAEEPENPSPDTDPQSNPESGTAAAPSSEHTPETDTAGKASPAVEAASGDVYRPRPTQQPREPYDDTPEPVNPGNAIFTLLLTAAAVIAGLGALWYLLPLGKGLITLWHQSLGGFSYGHQSGYPLAVWLMQAAALATDGSLQQQVVPFVALYAIALFKTAGLARRLYAGAPSAVAMAVALGLIALSPLLMLTPFIDPRGALVAFTVLLHVCTATIIGRRPPSVGGAVAFGMTGGLMLLAGPEGMVVAPVSLLWLLSQKWLLRHEGWLAVGVAVLVWSPQLVFNATHDISPLTALADWWYEPRFATDALFTAALHTLAVANVAVVLLALGGLFISLGRGLMAPASGWRMTGWAAAVLAAYTVVLWANPDAAAAPAGLPAALLLMIAAIAVQAAQRYRDRNADAYSGHSRHWAVRIGVVLLALVAGYRAYIWQDSLFAANIGEPSPRLRSVLQTPCDVLAAAGDDCAQAAFELRNILKPDAVQCIGPASKTLAADAEKRSLVFRCNAGILDSLGCTRPDVQGLAGWCLCEGSVARKDLVAPAVPQPAEPPAHVPAQEPAVPREPQNPPPAQTPDAVPSPGPATIDI